MQVSLGLSWPALVLDIIGWLRSVLVLDLSATSPECSVRMDYLSKFAFFLLFPVLLVAVMCTIGRLKKCCVSRTRLASGPTDAELEMLPLPEGWEKKVSEEGGGDNSGRVFYVDSNTNSTQWEHPVAAERPAALYGPEAAERRYKTALQEIDDKVTSSLFLWAKMLCV